MTLFTHLKIILLQYFQFSTINDIKRTFRARLIRVFKQKFSVF